MYIEELNCDITECKFKLINILLNKKLSKDEYKKLKNNLIKINNLEISFMNKETLDYEKVIFEVREYIDSITTNKGKKLIKY